MRIAYICDFFHPDAGYHPNLLSKYWTKFGNQVFMLTSELEKMPSSLTNFFDCNNIEQKDKEFAEKYGVEIIRCPIYRFVSGRSIYKNAIFQELKKINPDVVYVNGNDSLIGMELVLTYKRHSYGLVMDSHMLDIASNNKFKKIYRAVYRKTIAKKIIRENIPVIRAQNDDFVEKHLGIPLERCPWISFGSDMLLFHEDSEIRIKKREEYGIPQDAFVILYAGKINKTKGMDLFAEAIKEKFITYREVCVVVVGSTEGESGALIDSSLKNSDNHILRYPTQKYTDLPQFYQMADIAVFPRQCSLSFFDVQACGLPVVFEDNNINIDRSSSHNALVFQSANASGLRKAIETFLEMDKEEFNVFKSNAIEYVKKTYNYEDKAREYIPYLESQVKAKRR